VTEAAAASSLPPPRSRAPFSAWWTAGLLLFFYVLGNLDRVIMTMLIDPMKADLRLSDFQISLVVGPAFAASYALFAMPFGWAADRYSRLWVAFTGIVVWSGATAGVGFATSLAALAAGRLLVGAGESSITPVAYSLIADKFPPDRLTSGMAIFAMGPKTGQAVAFSLGGLTIGLATHLVAARSPWVGDLKAWQLVFVIFGLAGLASTLLLLTLLEPRRTRRRAASPAGGEARLMPYLAANPRLIICLILGFAVINMVNSAVSTWLPTYMGRAFGWSAPRYGPILGAVSLVAASTLLFSGVVVDAVYKRGVKDAHVRLYGWIVVGLAPTLLLAFWVRDPYAFVALYGLIQALGFSYILYMSTTLQLICPPEMRGRLSALFMFVIVVTGIGMGGPLVAAITDFVFHDPAKLGWSICIVGVSACAISLTCLRLALPLIRPAIEARERAAAG